MQKTGGAGVTVEERAMAEAVRIDDALGSLPDQKIELDRLTVFVATDSAFALMTAEIGRCTLRVISLANYCTELHVRIQWTLEKSPIHGNLLVIIGQSDESCRAGYRLWKSEKTPGPKREFGSRFRWEVDAVSIEDSFGAEFSAMWRRKVIEEGGARLFQAERLRGPGQLH